jgi:transcriptional regulator with GAF, ATPase, and Fis domain
MVREKRFREDLYYRLMVVPIHVPPLRNRRSDIVPLVLAFLRARSCPSTPRRSPSAAKPWTFMQQYSWPGNVRELENTLERTVVLATDGETLSAHDIPVLDRLFPTLAPPIDPHGVGHSQPPQGSWGFAPRGMHSNAPSHANISDERRPYQRAMLSREEILQALDATNGHQTMAARALGVTLRQLRYKIQLLELDPRQFRK